VTGAAPSDIVAYFDRCEVDYRLLWDLDRSLAMHIGYWDATTRSLRAALRRQNEVLAALAHVGPADHVLDAGCGVGGSAIFLAQRFGCRVAGVTLSARQAATARRHAAAHGVGDRTAFLVEDYARTGFADASFDVVWALESVCYAASKRAFLCEAARVLRPGGRLVVADGFATRASYPPAEAALMRRCLGNWAVPGLETAEAFCAQAREAGLADVSATDVTRTILPSTRRLFLHSLYGFPLGKLAELVGLRDPVQTRNIVAARYPHRLCKRNLIRYVMVSGRKPSASPTLESSAARTRARS
jgi:cyclopropane fatty-acyl-phospholipid synthase-like methyltransferase